MSTVLTRGITGIVLISIITTAILASLYSFIGLLFIINLLGLIEFYKLIAKEPIHPNLKEGIFLSVVLFLSSSLMLCRYFDWPVLLINVVSVAIIFFLELYRSSSNPFQNLALTFFGIIYITLPIILFEGISLLPFHEGAYHPKIILGYFILLWMSDSAAYAVGNLAGRHKLFERISPKKTWEGSIGGGLFAFGSAYLISIFVNEVSLRDWMIMCLIIVVMGTYGDLFKSILKRSANVKDSGNLLPGHGGILDRFDSLIGSAPFVFGYLLFFRDSEFLF